MYYCRCKGNVILELQDADAAMKLSSYLARYHKETSRVSHNELYIEVFQRDVSRNALQAPNTAVYQIVGGDPSHGGIVVNTTKVNLGKWTTCPVFVLS